MCFIAWSVDVIPKHCLISSITLLSSLMAVGTCLGEHALFISLCDAVNIVGSDVDVLGGLVLKVLTLLDAAAELLLLVLLVVRWISLPW